MQGLVIVIGGGRKSGDLVVIKFDDGGMDTDGGKEFLHDIAHAAEGSAEDDNRVLGDETLDSGLG